MVRHYNKVLLRGNLTRDPELRYTNDGTAVCDFGLAVNNEYTSDDDDTVFIDITVWAKQAENINKHIGKGDPVFVEGRLTQNYWETDGGQQRSDIEVGNANVDFLPSGDSSGIPEDDEQQDVPEEAGGDIPF